MEQPRRLLAPVHRAVSPQVLRTWRATAAGPPRGWVGPGPTRPPPGPIRRLSRPNGTSLSLGDTGRPTEASLASPIESLTSAVTPPFFGQRRGRLSDYTDSRRPGNGSADEWESPQPMTSQGSTPTVVVELEKHPTLPMRACTLGEDDHGSCPPATSADRPSSGSDLGTFVRSLAAILLWHT